jgi:hypothetical protein
VMDVRRRGALSRRSLGKRGTNEDSTEASVMKKTNVASTGYMSLGGL